MSRDQRGARDQERGVESASRREALAAAVARRRVPSLRSEQSPSLPFCCSGLPPPLLEIRPIWSEGKEEVQTAAATRVVSCCTNHRRRCCCWRRELRLCVSDRQGWFCDFRDHLRSFGLSFCHLGPCYCVARVLTTEKPRCHYGCSPL
nr:uncharacterized protein LOC112800805 [Arachis hypogaea]